MSALNSRKVKGSGFNICNSRGFQIISNDIVVSVQFGWGNYCSNRDEDSPITSGDTVRRWSMLECENAEVSVFDAEGGDWMTREVWQEVFGEDPESDVVGYVTADKVAKIIAHVNGMEVRGK